MQKPPDQKKKAVALEYDTKKDPAPRITAKGSGSIAEKILEIARANDIPVQEDASLVEILSKLDLDTVIPLEAYAAVAEILNFVYRSNAAARKRKEKRL